MTELLQHQSFLIVFARSSRSKIWNVWSLISSPGAEVNSILAFGFDDAGLGGSGLLLRLERRLALLTGDEAMSEDSVCFVFMAAFVESID